MKKFLLFSAAAISAALAFADYRAIIYSGGSPVSQNKIQNITKITAANETLTETTVDSVKNYQVASVDSMVFVSDTVFVSYNGNKVTIVNPLYDFGLIVAAIDANVVVTADALDMKDVVFVLSGTSTNGAFYMNQQKRVSVVLDNLNLTSSYGPALAMIGDKGVSLELKGTNTLTDASTRTGADTSYTSTLYVNDKLEVSGTGSLVVVGSYKNGIFVKDDLIMNGGAITVSSQNSAVRVKDNLEVNAGSIEVLNTNKGDGIDVNDTIYVKGGALTSTVVATDSKAITCDAGYVQSAGTVTVSVLGDGSKGIKVGTAEVGTDSVAGNLLISGGTCSVTLTDVAKDDLSDASPAGLKSDGAINITGGNVSVVANSGSSAVKGVAADGDIYAHGSSVVNVNIQCSKGKAWCFKSDGKIYIKPSCVTATFNTDNSKYDSDSAGYYSPAYTEVSE